QVRVTGAAAAGTDRQLTGELGVGRGGERSGLLVVAVHPLQVLVGADRLGDRVQAVPDQSVDAAHSRGVESIDQLFSHLRHVVLLCYGAIGSLTTWLKQRTWRAVSI